MPAEWEPQFATWLSWPWNQETWPKNLVAARAEFVGLVDVICQSQPVIVLVPTTYMHVAKQQLPEHPNLELVELPTNDAWARDYAPTFVKETSTGSLVSIDWYYNAWGEKYPPFDDDQQVAKSVADRLGIQNIAGGLCLEGGAIEINSSGVLLTTESCVLNPNRNPDMSRCAVEAIFAEKVGCSKLVWLPGDIGDSAAIVGDDTDGHIDQLARFLNDNTIVHAWVNKNDPRHSALASNVDAIRQQLPTAELIPLGLPDTFTFYGRNIPASYCNFLVTNKSVIVPQFDVAEDVTAVEILEASIPDREIIPLPSRNLAVGLGSFHCLSQQQPA